MTLEEYVTEKYPKISLEYKRRVEYKWEDLKVGMKLLMLRSGFSGNAFVVREIVEISKDNFGNFARLSAPEYTPARTSLLYENSESYDYDRKIEHFSKSCYIMTDEDDFKGMPYKMYRKHIFEKTGYII